MLKYENFQPVLLTTTSVANHISKFATAPRPWVAFTNFYATTLSVLMTRCSMNFSLISLPVSPCIFPSILAMQIRMITPTIPIPIYLLSTPMIQSISLKISKMKFVQLQYQPTSMRHKD